ncbi:hypothetical protein CPB83DRAFT_463302 [Crepidotus variabilis]|uniref:Uncharacterized protein n=1 Tax=Crepidotus variabilis TaxID=179855 RepID=A0A9P6JNC5_9AGAR|nr:hypothetical protein CPB83DRAFT_463302 [Crepidotus variabilis]
MFLSSGFKLSLSFFLYVIRYSISIFQSLSSLIRNLTTHSLSLSHYPLICLSLFIPLRSIASHRYPILFSLNSYAAYIYLYHRTIPHKGSNPNLNHFQILVSRFTYTLNF